MKTQEIDETYFLPIWITKENVMTILECRKSSAAEKIRQINGDIHSKVVGCRCLTEKFIEFYEGEISRETILSALSKTPKLQNISTNSTKSK